MADHFFDLVDDCRHGRFMVPIDDVYVGNALKRYGEYSEGELALLRQCAKPRSRVVCVGANLGALVVPLAKNGITELVCFEPQRWVYQLLCANIVLNNLINVRAYWAACGATSGGVKVPVLKPELQNNFGALELPAITPDIPGDIVPRLTLDTVPDIDMSLLTIDVEGMELDVLTGAENVIARCRPIIFFEADRAAKRPALFAWMRAHKYALYWYKTYLFNPENWRHNTTDVWRKDANSPQIITENVLGVPRERTDTVSLVGFTEIPLSEEGG